MRLQWLSMARVAPLVRRPVEIHPEARYPEIGIRSFGRGTFHKADVEGAAVGTKRLFEVHAGDLLFNIVFAWEGAVAVAQPSDHGRFGSIDS
jgi:type I restriction enzyme S subunit